MKPSKMASRMANLVNILINFNLFSVLISIYLPVIIFNSSCVSLLKEEFLYPNTINNRIKSYRFELTEGIVQPDNYRQVGYLINGRFPGPTIFVNQFDTLEVTVINKMTTGVSIHFHGLLQEHSAGSDGVPFVTQQPIMPNQTFKYEIPIGTQTGTFVYHGHMDFDIVFIHGALIIRDNPSFWHSLGTDYRYEMGYEYIFLLEEIYHKSLDEILVDVTGPWKGKPEIKSYPINGLSYGQWPKNNGDAPGYEVVPVIPGQTYRLRVINIASDSMLRFRIEGHRLRVIEMDGILCFPIWTDHLEINSGQRYSVMVTMDKNVDNYWIHSELLSPFFGGPDNGRAILHYVGADNPTPMRKRLFQGATPTVSPSSWILPQLMPNRLLPQSEVYELPKKYNKRIVIDAYMRYIDGYYKFYINGHHYEQPKLNYLQQVRNGVNIAKTDGHQVYEIQEGQVVDIVFQNRVMDDGPCLQHPWHLHGHSFYVVAEGPDTVDLGNLDSEISKNLLLGRLQFRDVFTMFPFQKEENQTNGAGCGWAVIRFVANNPGVWLAHCHITTHMLIGKMFVIYEYRKENPKLINE